MHDLNFWDIFFIGGLGVLMAFLVARHWLKAPSREALGPLPVKKFRVRIADTVKGPYSLENLHVLSDAGGITPETPCRYEGSEDWISYEQVMAAEAKLTGVWSRLNAPSRADFFEQASTVATIVLVGIFVWQAADGSFEKLRREEDRGLMRLDAETSYANNLPRAAETFRRELAGEDGEALASAVTAHRAWNNLTETLGAYATRLVILQSQSRAMDNLLEKRRTWQTWTMISAMIGMVILNSLARDRRRRVDAVRARI
jgi:hypothetical protein